MARLPLDQGIPRFKDNEERIDIMTNGGEDASWQTADGVTVPSVRKWFKDINAEGEGWMAKAEEAAVIAQSRTDIVLTTAFGAVGATLDTLTYSMDGVVAGAVVRAGDTNWLWNVLDASESEFNYEGTGGVKYLVVQGAQVMSPVAGKATIYRERRYLDALPLSPWDFTSEITYKPDWDNPRTWDWGPAIQAAFDRAPDVNLPAGYYPLHSPVTIGNDQEGGSLASLSGREGCTMESFITDGSYAITLAGTEANRLSGFRMGGFRMTGGGRAQNLIDTAYLGMCEFDSIDLQDTEGLAFRSKGNWDCKVTRSAFRSCGHFVNQIPAVELITYDSDGNNAIKFLDCHFESNRYTYALIRNPTGSARTNGLIWFTDTKFHGRHVTTADIHPFIDTDGHINVHGCYFYLAGDHFIKLRGTTGSVIMGNWFAVGQNVSSSVWMATASVRNMIGPNQYSSVAPPIEETPASLNFILEPFGGIMRMRDGSAVYDDGGRAALAKNILRSGATYYQPVGSTASNSLRITNEDTESMQLVRADAGGVDGGAVSIYSQWSYGPNNGMRIRIPAAFAAARPTRTVMSPDGAPYIPAYPGSAIGSSASVINTSGKYDGKPVRDSSNSKKLVIADGPSPTDVWRFPDGTIAYTPS